MRIVARAALAAALVLATQAALADAGKVGQWRVTTQSSVSDPKHVLINLPAKLADAIRQNGNSTSTKYYCMSAEMVAASKVALGGGCTTGDTEISGQTLETSFSCTGNNPGKGHISVTYDKPEHYTGESSFTPADGEGLRIKSTVEGTWLADACSSPGN